MSQRDDGFSFELIVTGLRQAAETVRTAAMGRRLEFGELGSAEDNVVWRIPAELYALAGRIESDARQLVATEAYSASLIKRAGPAVVAEDDSLRECSDAAAAIAFTLPEVGTYVPPADGMRAPDRAEALRSAEAILRSVSTALPGTAFQTCAPTVELDEIADRLSGIADRLE